MVLRYGHGKFQAEAARCAQDDASAFGLAGWGPFASLYTGSGLGNILYLSLVKSSDNNYFSYYKF